MRSVCDAPTVRGGTWSRDGTIVFAANPGGLFKVPATGGQPMTSQLPMSPARRSHIVIRHFSRMVGIFCTSSSRRTRSGSDRSIRTRRRVCLQRTRKDSTPRLGICSLNVRALCSPSRLTRATRRWWAMPCRSPSDWRLTSAAMQRSRHPTAAFSSIAPTDSARSLAPDGGFDATSL